MTKSEIIARETARSGYRGKINAKCCECIYDDSGGAGGNWRQQVTACTSRNCPLWEVRPITTKE